MESTVTLSSTPASPPPKATETPASPPKPEVAEGKSELPGAKPKSKATRNVLLGLGGLVLLLAAVIVFVKLRGPSEEGLEVETSRAQVRAITQTVTASGEVRPEVEIKISSDVSGEVVFLAVEEGDRVERGQLLVRVQPEFYAAEREQAESGVLQAQADAARTRAELERARADLERQRLLFERGVIPRVDLDAAQTAYQVAQASQQGADYRIQSARSSLAQAGQQLARTNIYSPISGVVSQLNVELGERVVGTSQMSGTELMVIAELDRMLIEVDINENDVVNVELDDSARVEVDAYPDRPLRGLVSQIANSARVSGQGTQDQVTNFPVEVRVLDAERAGDTPDADSATGGPAARPASERPRGVAASAPAVLRPGMSGTVDIFTRTVPSAVVVPIQAVTVRDVNAVRREQEREAARERGEDVEDDTTAADQPEDLRRVVFVLRDGKAEMVEVETGIADETHVEIRSGLRGGETVISGPFRALRTDLRPGQAVQPRPAGSLSSDEEEE